MFFALMRKEIIAHVLSLRFGVTFALFLLLVFASIYVTTNEYRRDQDEAFAVDRAADADLRKIFTEEEKVEDRFYAVFYHHGRREAVPPPPMSSLVQGLRPAMPAAVQITPGNSRYVGRSIEGNPLAGLLPIPDLVYVVGIVLSLLAILFAFDSICGEKEAGTLRLIMSNAVPRDSILLAKWAAGFLVLLVPFLIAVFGGVVYTWYVGALPTDADTLARLGTLLGFACLYISTFFTLSLAVSAVTHRSSTSLFLCLLIWVVWILVIPNLAPVVAKIIEPGYSPLKIAQEKEAVYREIHLRIQRLTLTTGKVSYGKGIEEEKEKLERERTRRLEQWDRFQSDSIDRQKRLAGIFGRLSPAACWTYAAVAVAGTGAESYQAFENASKQMSDDMRKTAESIRPPPQRDVRDFTLDELPRLKLTSVPFARAAEPAVNDLLILAILNVAFFMTAFVCFLRYDVR